MIIKIKTKYLVKFINFGEASSVSPNIFYNTTEQDYRTYFSYAKYNLMNALQFCEPEFLSEEIKEYFSSYMENGMYHKEEIPSEIMGTGVEYLEQFIKTAKYGNVSIAKIYNPKLVFENKINDDIVWKQDIFRVRGKLDFVDEKSFFDTLKRAALRLFEDRKQGNIPFILDIDAWRNEYEDNKIDIADFAEELYDIFIKKLRFHLHDEKLTFIGGEEFILRYLCFVFCLYQFQRVPVHFLFGNYYIIACFMMRIFGGKLPIKTLAPYLSKYVSMNDFSKNVLLGSDEKENPIDRSFGEQRNLLDINLLNTVKDYFGFQKKKQRKSKRKSRKMRR